MYKASLGSSSKWSLCTQPIRSSLVSHHRLHHFLARERESYTNLIVDDVNAHREVQNHSAVTLNALVLVFATYITQVK